MLTVDIALPEVEELQKLVQHGQEKGFLTYDEIVAGRLVPVLTDWELPSLTINFAYQSRRHQPAKIRVFTEFFLQRFKDLDIEKKWASSLQ